MDAWTTDGAVATELETIDFVDDLETDDMTVKRPLGELLLERELIIHHDLEFALKHQEKSYDLLGQILVRMGALDAADLEATLQIQKEMAGNA